MILISILRSLIGVIAFALLTAVMSFILILEALTINHRPFEDEWVRIWSLVTLRIFGVRMVVQGLNNIPEGTCLFLFNHTSFFDIFVMYAAYPHFRFGAKIELFSIPLFGTAMLKAGALPIARKNRDEVMKVYEMAAKRAQAGEKFALSPEGGRSAEEKLMPFKAGPFLFAINAGMPLVPVVISGAKEILGKDQYLPNWNKLSRDLHVHFLPAISVEGKTDEDKKDLQQRVFKEMSEKLAQSSLN